MPHTHEWKCRDRFGDHARRVTAIVIIALGMTIAGLAFLGFIAILLLIES
jgi:hypothetical protein